jgi:hypothetical protein
MSTPESAVYALFKQAIQAYNAGDHETARKHMRQVLLDDPGYVPGWLWMSALVDDPIRQRECLERALVLDPQCEPARRGLRILRMQDTADAASSAPSASMPIDPSQDPGQRQARRLGEYLVEQGLISRKQLEEALEEQRLFWKKTQGVRAPLGNILINNGMLSPQTLATALVVQQQDRLHGLEKHSPQYIGEYLVSKGIISAPQLELVLAEQMRLRQRGTSMLIGELLIHAGYITRDVLENVLEQQREEIFSRFGFED